MPESLTDKILLLSTDEQTAFELLYNRYWEQLYKKAYQRLGNSDDAQDVVQEVFVSLWRNRDKIDVENTLAPYLFTALKYCIISQVYRKAKKGITVPLAIEELERIEVSTEELLEFKELQLIVNNEVANLPERMREVYRLSRIEHLQVAEIALRLNLSEQTVKNTLTIALKRLREKLARYSTICLFMI